MTPKGKQKPEEKIPDETTFGGGTHFEVPKKPATDNRAKRLALLLQAIDEVEREFAETRTEFKDRIMRLRNQAFMLRSEIISGQEALPLEE